jgi:hypothetical protein
MTFETRINPRRARLLRKPIAIIGLGVLLGGPVTAMAAGAALADDGAAVFRGYKCSLGGTTTTNSFAVETPSGNAQSSCHSGPDGTGPATGGGAAVFHDAGCFTLAGVQHQSIFVFTPSGAANAVCLANPGG